MRLGQRVARIEERVSARVGQGGMLVLLRQVLGVYGEHPALPATSESQARAEGHLEAVLKEAHHER